MESKGIFKEMNCDIEKFFTYSDDFIAKQKENSINNPIS